MEMKIHGFGPDICDCGPHSTCKPGDETCIGCGKKCPQDRSKIEESEE